MEAERRQVTVLFTDMVGFTSFSERSGEEAAYTLMRSLSKLMAEPVREQGGVVQNFTGDGIMAVFGAPVAFEDAPLRACRAALSILKRLKAEGPELETKHGVRPQMRVGLNTGAAVVGKVEEGADAGVTVLGDTVNFAARLQALADPDSAFLSEPRRRKVKFDAYRPGRAANGSDPHTPKQVRRRAPQGRKLLRAWRTVFHR
jgi:class 3 adenylate cyclase